ncbi:MAG: ATP-binding protein [Coleofasciculaceae cyanobacterium]
MTFMGQLNLPRFYKACNPSKPLIVGDVTDQKYYIDFSSVRGNKIIESLQRTVTLISPDEPTCQLFTGHIGCGKSTELLRLKTELERQKFYVVYFESSQDLDLADVDITDILLSVAGQVSESLEAIQINLYPDYFTKLFGEIADFLQIPIEFEADAQLASSIGLITSKTKETPKLRRQLREYLEPRTSSILQSINQELIEPAITQLKQRGLAGLVVIVDNLDRVDLRPLSSGRTQPEYLFIDRGEQLRKLRCHVVYTIPLALIFSNEAETLKNRLGGGLTPKVLPMVPTRQRNGQDCPHGIALLRQMVIVRAFPGETSEKQLELITEVFDRRETLDRLCRISGGHVRNLLGLLSDCLRQEDPPISADCLENVIRERRDFLTTSITDREWELLFQVVQQQSVRADTEYQNLLRGMFVFEYRDQEGTWFGLNPALEEAQKFQSWLKQN